MMITMDHLVNTVRGPPLLNRIQSIHFGFSVGFCQCSCRNEHCCTANPS